MESKIKLGELVKILDDILELDDAGGHWKIEISPQGDDLGDEVTIGFIAPWGGTWIAIMKNVGFNAGETAQRIIALHNNYGHILHNVNSIDKAMQRIFTEKMSAKEIIRILKDLYND